MKILYIHRHNNPSKPSMYRGFEPMINAFKEKNEVTEIFLPYEAGNLLGILKNIWFVRKHRIKNGINHVTGETHYAIIGLIGVPSVLTIHDDYALSYDKRGGIQRWLKWLIYMFLPIKLADKVECITPSTKKCIDGYVSNKKTEVVIHQDLSSDFPYTPKEFNEECPVFFHMGTGPNKNLETTLKALAGLNCKLRVLKKMTTEQINLAKDLHINYVNRFNLSNEEVFDEYKQSDIVLFPTLCEGLGMPTLEGQSIGRPVITTDKEPMNWVAGDAALLIKNPLDHIEIRNCINLIINDKSLREDLIRKGLKNVKRFSLQQAVKDYTRVYKEALNKHKL